MALTNDSELADRMERYRSHGISSNPSQMKQRPADEIWNYQQIKLGFNYRMTDIQAALGISQMNRLDEFVQKRNKIAKWYNDELSKLPLQIPIQHKDSYSSYHLYPIRINLSETKQSQRQIYNALQLSGINVNLHYIPIYRQPYYESMGFKAGYCEEAERYHKDALSIPMYPKLSTTQQVYVVESLKLALLEKIS